MYGQGWVVSNADLQKIRRQEKRREEQKKNFEEQQKQGQDKVKSAGLRQFGASTSEVNLNLTRSHQGQLIHGAVRWSVKFCSCALSSTALQTHTFVGACLALPVHVGLCPLCTQYTFIMPQALDNLFKNETVGLQTRDEFVQKRATLQDRCAATASCCTCDNPWFTNHPLLACMPWSHGSRTCSACQLHWACFRSCRSADINAGASGRLPNAVQD